MYILFVFDILLYLLYCHIIVYIMIVSGHPVLLLLKIVWSANAHFDCVMMAHQLYISVNSPINSLCTITTVYCIMYRVNFKFLNYLTYWLSRSEKKFLHEALFHGTNGRSRKRMYPGTFVSGNECSRERWIRVPSWESLGNELSCERMFLIPFSTQTRTGGVLGAVPSSAV